MPGTSRLLGEVAQRIGVEAWQRSARALVAQATWCDSVTSASCDTYPNSLGFPSFRLARSAGHRGRTATRSRSLDRLAREHGCLICLATFSQRSASSLELCRCASSFALRSATTRAPLRLVAAASLQCLEAIERSSELAGAARSASRHFRSWPPQAQRRADRRREIARSFTRIDKRERSRTRALFSLINVAELMRPASRASVPDSRPKRVPRRSDSACRPRSRKSNLGMPHRTRGTKPLLPRSPCAIKRGVVSSDPTVSAPIRRVSLQDRRLSSGTAARRARSGRTGADGSTSDTSATNVLYPDR